MEKPFCKYMITSKWEGRDNKFSPLGITLEVREDTNNEFFNKLLDETGFNAYIEEIKNREPEEYFKEWHHKQLEKLKRDCEGAKPKITIKIELEKYE